MHFNFTQYRAGDHVMLILADWNEQELKGFDRRVATISQVCYHLHGPVILLWDYRLESDEPMPYGPDHLYGAGYFDLLHRAAPLLTTTPLRIGDRVTITRDELRAKASWGSLHTNTTKDDPSPWLGVTGTIVDIALAHASDPWGNAKCPADALYEVRLDTPVRVHSSTYTNGYADYEHWTCLGSELERAQIRGQEAIVEAERDKYKELYEQALRQSMEAQSRSSDMSPSRPAPQSPSPWSPMAQRIDGGSWVQPDLERRMREAEQARAIGNAVNYPPPGHPDFHGFPNDSGDY